MPLYLYKCNTCGEKREVDHGMSDNPEILCDKCQEQCAKLPGVGAVTFRGSGWGSQ